MEKTIIDQTIDDLLAAEAVTADDLFVVQQNATAKKVSGEILRKYLGQESGLPNPDGAEEGSFLRVRDKKWVAETVPAGGTDISLGLTAATVGQTVKVKAVNTDGVPTAWENYFPGYHMLCTQKLEEEATSIVWTHDINGRAFDLSGLQEVNLALSFPVDYTSDNLNFHYFGEGYAFSNGETFRYAVVKNTIFSPKLVYKESIVFKSTSYQWQSNAVRRPYYAIVPENTDMVHPAKISLTGGKKAFPVGTIASVYVR